MTVHLKNKKRGNERAICILSPVGAPYNDSSFFRFFLLDAILDLSN